MVTPYPPPPIYFNPYWSSWPVVPTVRGWTPEELYGPPPPPQPPLALRLPTPVVVPPRAKRVDPAKAQEQVVLGDRHFRAKDMPRAAERYEQARRAQPSSALPRIRLAQVALVREQYAEAANRLREALAAEPDWLTRAPDIQDLFGEPAAFKGQIAKLERHLQARPNDRDAWLVLGAELFLAGRVQQAADVFLRLSDRKADPTLAAFLDASKANPR
ncbi:MAG TPA: tetratricopeptide repeat protein [Isosphaeraceae bacterium]